ncbi:sugar porter family MFS transporter [Ornithinimicrobium cryptoxanthini]|uniref:Sugar porter family MFS transporter n=1 Tax=Ornithinimicrobium cryptoxanthini TaxID=2934161 RepID=A0ABY4YDH9_9MICO|nr:sugar porter family MFS transporter [Ornithinimicrobium cryptoxanthini]USQ74821.1 sugar porter family MFS transporter [Ornithinimicrobium cryptoxanthini]
MADESHQQTTQKDYVLSQAILLTSVAALGGFLFGFDTAVINGAVNAMREDFEMGSALTGFVVSSALLGCVAGAYLAGQLAERVGRIKVMLLASVLFTISAIGSGLAFGAWDMIVWRVVGGLGVGAASVIAPAYIAEVSPASIRGRLGSLQQMAIVLGIFVALLSDYFIAGVAGGSGESLWGSTAWRWMFWAEVIPAVAYGVLALTIPESPRYLVARGKVDEAKNVLGRVMLRGIPERISEIQRTVRRDARASLRDLRNSAGKVLPIVWIGIALSVFQQFVGINVIFYYSSTLWQAVGFTEDDALTQTVLTSVTNIVVTVVAIALIDKIGRRVLLLIGSAGMFLSLGTMAWAFASAPVVDGAPELSDSMALVALVAANAFVVFFGMSWGPGVWVLLGEMFNNAIRATALGVAAAAQWLANFAISTSFPVMADVGLGFAYGFYTLFALLSFFFVLKWVPETKGRELEDMD